MMENMNCEIDWKYMMYEAKGVTMFQNCFLYDSIEMHFIFVGFIGV